eukprot:gene23077-16874_t
MRVGGVALAILVAAVALSLLLIDDGATPRAWARAAGIAGPSATHGAAAATAALRALGARARRWGRGHVDGGAGTSMGARARRWGRGHVDGGAGTSMGARA